MSKSLRLSVPTTSRPARVLPHGSVSVPWITTSSLISRGDAVHREVAVHARRLAVDGLDASGLEGDLRERLGIEEVGRAQVLVALRLAGVDRRDLDRPVRPAVGDLLLHVEGALELAELAAHVGDPHVLDRELDARVRRIDGPRSGVDEWTSAGRHVVLLEALVGEPAQSTPPRTSWREAGA